MLDKQGVEGEVSHLWAVANLGACVIVELLVVVHLVSARGCVNASVRVCFACVCVYIVHPQVCFQLLVNSPPNKDEPGESLGLLLLFRRFTTLRALFFECAPCMCNMLAMSSRCSPLKSKLLPVGATFRICQFDTMAYLD